MLRDLVLAARTGRGISQPRAYCFAELCTILFLFSLTAANESHEKMLHRSLLLLLLFFAHLADTEIEEGKDGEEREK